MVGWPEWEQRLEAIRDQVARLINADRDEIAFVNSTTHGIGLVAEGFPWRPGDSVVTAAEEYPSNIYPWMNLASRGVDLRLVPSRDGRIWVDDLAAAIDALDPGPDDQPRRVRLAASATTSMRWPSSAGQRGVALFVDAIQGLGPLRIDVRRTPIDFLAADGHKWLLGPEGAGLLYVRRDWIDRLRPIGVGWHSVVGSYNSPRNRLPAQAQRRALGGGLVQHAGPAGASAPASGCSSSWGLEAVVAPDPRPGRRRPRAGRVGRLDGLRLAARARTARRSSSSSATGSIPTWRRASCGAPGRRRGLPAGAAPGQPARLQQSTRTSSGSEPAWPASLTHGPSPHRSRPRHETNPTQTRIARPCSPARSTRSRSATST